MTSTVTVRQRRTVGAILQFIVVPAFVGLLGGFLVVVVSRQTDGLVPHVFGWPMLAIGVLGVPYSIWYLFGLPPVVLVVDDDGIAGRHRSRWWFVEWSEVQSVHRWTMITQGRDKPGLAVLTRTPPDRIPFSWRVNHIVPGLPIEASGRLLLWVPGMTPSLDDVLDVISERGVEVIDRR